MNWRKNGNSADAAAVKSAGEARSSRIVKYSVTSESEPVEAVKMVPRERVRLWWDETCDLEWVSRVEKERERQAFLSELAGLVPSTFVSV